MNLTEYDVSFAVKEHLIKNGYIIITWNPPGSQGTFTIPNPGKESGYKGQTGSEAPDLIAFKGQEMLILEAKDNISKSIKDINKMKALLANAARKELLLNLCKYQMDAIDIDFDPTECEIKMGIAIPCEGNIDDAKMSNQDIRFYVISLANKKWNSKVIKDPSIIKKAFKVCVF